MELNACLEKYIELTGREDIKETVFFEDTPDIIGIYAPGWDFSIEEKNKGYLGKAVCASSFYTGGEIYIEDRNQLELPAELERRAITECLENEEKRGEFIFCLLAGRLLLITGDMDNNVHPASTARLADALIRARKRFDMTVIPGADHGLGNSYYVNLIRYYFTEHLLGLPQQEIDIVKHN